MSNMDYFKLWLTGKKSESMMDIETRYPELDGFDRRTAILSAIGCPTYHFKRGWLMFLPVHQHPEWENNEKVFFCNVILFSLYWRKI